MTKDNCEGNLSGQDACRSRFATLDDCCRVYLEKATIDGLAGDVAAARIRQALPKGIVEVRQGGNPVGREVR
jgi:hypothetical protein